MERRRVVRYLIVINGWQGAMTSFTLLVGTLVGTALGASLISMHGLNAFGARQGDVRKLDDASDQHVPKFFSNAAKNCPSACKAKHRFDLTKIPRFCSTARSSWPKGLLCPSDFAIGVVSSAKSIDRLQFMEYWITQSIASGAVVRVFFAQTPDWERVPKALRSIVVVLDMAEVGHHLATQLTFAMNARMLADFPGRKWYGKMDDDTFLMLPNAIMLMNRYIAARAWVRVVPV